jgi:hypothetical protein
MEISTQKFHLRYVEAVHVVVTKWFSLGRSCQCLEVKGEAEILVSFLEQVKSVYCLLYHINMLL